MQRARTSSNTYEHPTPDDLFVQLWRDFGPFDYDPATRPEFFTAKHVRRFSTLAGTFVNGGFPVECAHGLPGEWSGYTALDERDGLRYPWLGRVFCNPPYGRDMWRWVKRGHDAVREGEAQLVCMLLPVRSDLRWWAKYVGSEIERGTTGDYSFEAAGLHVAADYVRFLPGRVRYYEYVCGFCGHEHAGRECPAPCLCPPDAPHHVNRQTNAAPFPSVVVVWSK